MTKIKILVGYHKPAYLLKSDILVPIHLGRALATEASKDGVMSEEDYQWMLDNMIGDDTGDNISKENRKFAELTGIYWAWKNYDKLGNPDYIGFCHYRRYFDEHTILQNIATTDIILPEPYIHAETVKEQFCSYHQKEFLDIMLSKIKEVSPELLDFSEKFFLGHKQHLCNMFVMKKELFMEYAGWLFNIIFMLNKEVNYNDITVYNYRCPAFCAERLTSLWCEYKKKKNRIQELPYIFNNTNADSVLPIVNKHPNNIPIVFAADDNYINYVCVCIVSVLENANKNYNYDFYIVGEGLSTENKEKLSKIECLYKNAIIKTVNISSLSSSYDKSLFFSGISGNYNISTYYRFFISDIFQNFSKILYLDSDMIILNDISKLYLTDINNYFIAATKDTYVKVWRRIDKEFDSYVQHTLGLKSENDYFQAGVLLINITLFTKNKLKEKLFDKLKKVKTPKIVDQDILNSVLKGSVLYLDGQWDYDCNLESMVKHNPNILIRNLNMKEMSNHQIARNLPFIIHYAGENKPWKNPAWKFSDIWWKYAKMTPFYEEILYKNLKLQISNFDGNTAKEILNYSKNKLRYWRYKLLSHITFGKIHEHYKQKKKELKKRLKRVEIFLKG